MSIRTLVVASVHPGPRVLISAGVHGDEFEPMLAAANVAESLPGRLGKGRVTLVPVVNESAYLLGRRCGSDGLDLARVCPGRVDGSPTERAAHALSALIRDADYYIDLHTGGARLRVQPLSGYMLHPQADVLERQRRMARAFGLSVVWGTHPGLDGRSLSVARDADVPAIYVEYLGGGGAEGEIVEALEAGCLRVLQSLGMVDEAPASTVIEPLVIEDDRPESGHMQVRHPAPVSGVFEPRARLARRVDEGEPLGIVRDPRGGAGVVVGAESSGIVLVLRTFARVEAGESLGVIAASHPRAPLPRIRGADGVV